MWTWISDIFRSFLSLFDRVVYWFVGLLVSLFDQLANVKLFSDDTIGRFSDRIFFLVSVVMIFKVSFSIIKYIINPDTFTDNEKGMGKVIQSVILVLVCLASIRSVFDFAYHLQASLLKSNVIEKVILGVQAISVDEQIDAKNRIPFDLLSAFVRPNATEVEELSYDEEKKMYTCYMSGDVYMYTGAGNYNETFGNCLNNITNEKPTKYTIKLANGQDDTKEGQTGDIYNEARASYNYNQLLDIINDKYKDNSDLYLFEYKFIVSTAAGIFLAIMYLNFCVDLAIRSVKFGFLQLIAPIPIISMVDPKSSKNGMMSKWVENCISTYLGLFIRIAVVNFAILIIDIAFNNKMEVIGGDLPGGEPGIFIQVVIMFGAIMFAKEAPKLINELTGGKLSGDFKMNPFSRLPGGAALGAVAGGVAGMGAGAVAGGLATGGKAIGALAKGVKSGVTGNGFKFDSNGITRQLKKTGHGLANRAAGTANQALKGLGIKSNIPTPYSNGDSLDKDYKEALKAEKYDAKAEELYDKYTHNGNPDYERLYQNETFRRMVEQRNATKKEMQDAERNLSNLKNRLQAGGNVDVAAIAAAEQAARDAKDRFDVADGKLNNQGKLYAKDYERYQLYKRGKDLNSLNSSSSSPTYNATAAQNQPVSPASSSSVQQQTGGQMPSVTPPSRSGNGNNGNNP